MKKCLNLSKILAIFILVILFSWSASAQMQALVDKKAPALAFQKSIGKPAKRDFYKGKILVLDFWATWCAPCIANMPHFNKLAEKYAGDDFAFALISDEPDKTVSNFFENNTEPTHAYNLIDISKTTLNRFGIKFIPSCVVIDKNNIVRWAGLGQDLNEEILLAVLNGTPVPTSKKFIPGTIVSQEDIDKLVLESRNKLIESNSTPRFTASVINSKSANFGASTRYNAKGDFVEIRYTKTTPAKMLSLLTGFGKSQFIIDDPKILERAIDVHFALTEQEFTGKGFEDKFINGMPLRNKMIEILIDSLGLKAEVTIKEQDIYEILIDKPDQLKKFKSFNTAYSVSSKNGTKLIEKSQTINNFIDAVKNATGFVIKSAITDVEKYDFAIDISEEKSLESSLKLHGLKLIKSKGEVPNLKLINSSIKN